MKEFPICNHCGYYEVVRDGWARWNPETQEWELDNVFDYHFCLACEKDTNPNWTTKPPP